MSEKLFADKQYVIISGKSHVSHKGEYFFSEEVVMSIKDSYEEKIRKQLRLETDSQKILEFKYILSSLRIELLVRH